MSECEKIIAQYDEYFRQLNEGYENDLKNIVPTEWYAWIGIDHSGDTWTEYKFAPFDTSQSVINFMNEEKDGWIPECEYTVISDAELVVSVDDECIKYRRTLCKEELWVTEFKRTMSHEIDLDVLGLMRTAALAERGCLG